MEEIRDYYNNLAVEYDRDRFGNSYGKYIDRQEKAIVKKILKDKGRGKILDVGCGTGRFLEFSEYGLDISPEMIRVAKEKYPDKKLSIGSAEQTNFQDAYFEGVISFHLLMHLDRSATLKVLNEMNRILRKGGFMILDVPSQKRRQLVNYKPKNWHGANHFTRKELSSLLEDKWEIKSCVGIAFLPIHWIPKTLRNSMVVLDNFLCRTFLKEYSSYLLFALEKK